MYTRVSISWSRLIKYLWARTLMVVVYATVIYFLYDFLNIQSLAIPLSIATIMGTAISLLLGFRTNAAYNRWWEARKVWGAIVNDSRSLIRQANTFVDRELETKKGLVLKLAKQQIAWCWELNYNLRGLSTDEVLQKHLDKDEFEYVSQHANRHTAIQQLQGNHLAEMYAMGALDSYRLTAMDTTLSKLSDAMGKCERIKKTVFPIQYGYFARMSIDLFMVLLPFGLIESIGWLSIPITVLVVFFFGMIHAIATYLQDPFENRPTDTPMSAICNTIEINLLQLAEQKEVPEALSSDEDGVLW